MDETNLHSEPVESLENPDRSTFKVARKDRYSLLISTRCVSPDNEGLIDALELFLSRLLEQERQNATSEYITPWSG